MARRVAPGRQAHHTAVAEQVVLALDPDHLVAEVEIGAVVAVRRGEVGVDPGLPLALLHDQRCVGDQRVAADMVEMEMRVDDQVDLGRVAADRFEPRADLLARPVIEREQTGDARADARRRVVSAIRVQAGVEQHAALRVLDQIGRDRQLGAALAALHQTAEIAGQPTAGKSVEGDAHDSRTFASSNRRRAPSRSNARSRRVSGSHSLRATAKKSPP